MEKNSDGINSWTDFKRSTIAEEEIRNAKGIGGKQR